MKIYKIIIIGSYLLFGIILMYNNAFSYFEDKYYCKINNNKLEVSLKNTEDKTKCLEYCKKVDLKITQINQAIYNAKQYLNSKEDEDYRIQIIQNLEKDKSNLEIERKKLLDNLKQFEAYLFQKIKKLFDYYLKKEQLKLQSEYVYLNSLQKNYLRIGDESKLIENRKKLDNILFKIYLINRILTAQDFDELAPNLKYYLKK